jgi:hypothetical protein
MLALMPNMGTLAEPQNPNQEWRVMVPVLFGCCEQSAQCACQAVNNTEEILNQNDQIQDTVEENQDTLFQVAYTLGRMEGKIDNLNQTVEECCCMEDMGPTVPTNHGPDKHTDRTESVYVRNFKEASNTHLYGEAGEIFGKRYNDAVDTLAQATFIIPSGQKYVANATVPFYFHLGGGGATGDVVLSVTMWGKDSGGSAVLMVNTQITVTFTSTNEYQRYSFGNVDLSTLYDIFRIGIEREGTHVNDTLGAEMVLGGVEIEMPVDQ